MLRQPVAAAEEAWQCRPCRNAQRRRTTGNGLLRLYRLRLRRFKRGTNSRETRLECAPARGVGMDGHAECERRRGARRCQMAESRRCGRGRRGEATAGSVDECAGAVSSSGRGPDVRVRVCAAGAGRVRGCCCCLRLLLRLVEGGERACEGGGGRAAPERPRCEPPPRAAPRQQKGAPPPAHPRAASLIHARRLGLSSARSGSKTAQRRAQHSERQPRSVSSRAASHRISSAGRGSAARQPRQRRRGTCAVCRLLTQDTHRLPGARR
jgi:hypothetical protein